MAIIPKQIGWSQESNLIWEILRQLDQLTKVVSTSGGGGGGTNPTSTYIPYNNAGTFADSYLVNNTTSSVLKSVYGGNDVGIKCDFVNGDVYLGDPFGIIGPSSTSVYMYVTSGSEQISLNAGGNTYFYCEKATDYCYVGTYNSNLVFTNGSSVRLFDNSIYNGFEIIYNASLSDVTDVKIGDYTNTTTGTSIITDVTNSLIKSQYGGSEIGLKLDFANNEYNFGDINNINGGVNIQIQNSDKTIKTLFNASVFGFFGIDDGLNKFIELGDFGLFNNKTKLNIDDNNQIIKTSNQGNDIGLKLDFNAGRHWFGDWTSGTDQYLYIDSGMAIFELNSRNPISLNDNGTGTMISGSSSGPSGNYLVINVNGNQYKITLDTV